MGTSYDASRKRDKKTWRLTLTNVIALMCLSGAIAALLTSGRRHNVEFVIRNQVTEPVVLKCTSIDQDVLLWQFRVEANETVSGKWSYISDQLMRNNLSSLSDTRLEYVGVSTGSSNMKETLFASRNPATGNFELILTSDDIFYN